MNTLHVFLWALSGSVVPAFFIWKEGDDITVSDLYMLAFTLFLGPISLLMCVLMGFLYFAPVVVIKRGKK